MARRVESSVGIGPVRIVDQDSGQRLLGRQIGRAGESMMGLAREGIGRQRFHEAVVDARNTDLQRDERGNLISPERTSEVAFPSIYSEAYDAIIEKRFLNELGLQSAEKMSELHNRFRDDPEGFRVSADAYIEGILGGVSDEAYEPARAVLQTLASNHFTHIASRRAEQDFVDARFQSLHIIEAYINDAFTNEAMEGVDEEARTRQREQTEAFLEGELGFALNENIRMFNAEQVEVIRTQFNVARTLGAIQRTARPIFRQAVEVADIDTLVGQATQEALKNLPQELVDQFGGEGAARDAVANVIQLAGLETKVDLAVRDMHETNRFREMVSGVQMRMSHAMATDNDVELAQTLAALDPAQYRRPEYVSAVVSFQSQGRNLATALSSLQAQTIGLEQRIDNVAAREFGQVRAMASKLGVPLDPETGRVTWPRDILMAESGQRVAIARMQALLGAIEEQAGRRMSKDEIELYNHWERTKVNYGLAAEALGLDFDEVVRGTLMGDPEALANMRRIHQNAKPMIEHHRWTPRQAEIFDEIVVSDIMEQFTDIPADEWNQMQHKFRTAVTSAPGAARRILESAEQMGMLPSSAVEFIQGIANQLTDGEGPVDEGLLAGAMAAYDVLHRNGHANRAARSQLDGQTDTLDKFATLQRRGYRAIWTPEGYRLNQGTAAQVQRAWQGFALSEGSEAARLRAAGLKPDEASRSAIGEHLAETLNPTGWFSRGPRRAYPATLEVDVQDWVIHQVMSSGSTVKEALATLASENFAQVGYGASTIVMNRDGQRRDGSLVFAAPAALVTDAAIRANPAAFEAALQREIAREFAHFDVKGKEDRILITGLFPYDSPFAGGEGRVVAEPHYYAQAVISHDDVGMMIPLTDENGMVQNIDLNALSLRAVKSMEVDMNDRARALRLRMQSGRQVTQDEALELVRRHRLRQEGEGLSPRLVP